MILIVLLLSSVLTTGCNKATNSLISEPIEYPAWPLNYAETVAVLTTPERLHHFMFYHLSYTKDLTGADEWLEPEELFNRRKGDCEDFAIFGDYVLRQHGYDTSVYTIHYSRGLGHAILVVKDGGYNVFSNDELYLRYQASTKDEAVMAYVNKTRTVIQFERYYEYIPKWRR